MLPDDYDREDQVVFEFIAYFLHLLWMDLTALSQ